MYMCAYMYIYVHTRICLFVVWLFVCLQISDARERARGLTEAALEVCPRIETTRSEKALKKEIDALQRRLRRAEPKYGILRTYTCIVYY